VDNGGIFTIATGRMELGTRKYLEVLPVNAPVILYNGALIYDFNKEERIWTCGFRQDIRNLLKELLDRFLILGLKYSREGQCLFAAGE